MEINREKMKEELIQHAKEVARLMQYVYHPHTTIIIVGDRVEVVEGVQAFPVEWEVD